MPESDKRTGDPVSPSADSSEAMPEIEGKTAALLAVNGTLMRGLELHINMSRAGAVFLGERQTEPTYRLFSIRDVHPAMQRVHAGGVAVAVELYAVPFDGLCAILSREPPGLCIGKVRLEDGQTVLGVLGEAALCEGMPDISAWGGWRAYIARDGDVGGQSGLANPNR